MGRIYRLCHALDDLTSRAFQQQKGVDHHKRWRMRRAMARLRSKIRSLVDDLHRKLAKWLCLEYRAVLLPEFETSRMVRRGQRRIRSETARAMATWAHYRFRRRLLDKAREYPRCCKVVLVDEAYTSKTCGRCGALHPRLLGGSKVFVCPACGARCDRDLHAARNILLLLLRYLSDVPLDLGRDVALGPTPSPLGACSSDPFASCEPNGSL